jgi:hypothetical protein
MFDKEFVPYEQAIELRKLGFEDEYLAWWNFGEFRMFGWDVLLDGYAGEIDERPIAPTFAQAFRWFREKYDIDIDIDVVFSKHDDGISLKNYKVLIPFPDELFINVGLFTTYEEAEIECLKKLIEIVKNK